MKVKAKHISLELRKRIVKIPRKEHHKILHHIHKKHFVSKETLFYMKEYGPRSHLIHEIVKDSIPVLFLSVILAPFAGLALRSIFDKLSFLIPLVIMVPALNGMIGELGSMIASKFTTGLFLGKIKGNPWKSNFVKMLLHVKIKVAIASVLYISLLALFLSAVKGFQFDLMFALKIIFIGLVSSITIVGILFVISVIGGIIIFKRGEDPNNFLIPMSTSIADVVTLIVVSALALLLF